MPLSIVANSKRILGHNIFSCLSLDCVITIEYLLQIAPTYSEVHNKA